jgi:hypothetical protein
MAWKYSEMLLKHQMFYKKATDWTYTHNTRLQHTVTFTCSPAFRASLIFLIPFLAPTGAWGIH